MTYQVDAYTLKARLNGCPWYTQGSEDWVRAWFAVHDCIDGEPVADELVAEVDAVWQRYASNLMGKKT